MYATKRCHRERQNFMVSKSITRRSEYAIILYSLKTMPFERYALLVLDKMQVLG